MSAERNGDAGPTPCLDSRGLFCPEPIMLLHHRIRDMSAGEELVLLATDPATARDVPAFCHFLGHVLLEQQSEEGIYRYRIRKQGD